MKAEDTVKAGDELCRIVCQEYRTLNLEAKPCDGEDCERCMLIKQAEITFKATKEDERLKFTVWLEAHGNRGQVDLFKAGK